MFLGSLKWQLGPYFLEGLRRDRFVSNPPPQSYNEPYYDQTESRSSDQIPSYDEDFIPSLRDNLVKRVLKIKATRKSRISCELEDFGEVYAG